MIIIKIVGFMELFIAIVIVIVIIMNLIIFFELILISHSFNLNFNMVVIFKLFNQLMHYNPIIAFMIHLLVF